MGPGSGRLANTGLDMEAGLSCFWANCAEIDGEFYPLVWVLTTDTVTSAKAVYAGTYCLDTDPEGHCEE